VTENYLTPAILCTAVTAIINDPNFVLANKGSRAPLAMLAFAKTVVDKMQKSRGVDVHCHFDGLTMTVPATNEMEPQCHSVVGQKLLYEEPSRYIGVISLHTKDHQNIEEEALQPICRNQWSSQLHVPIPRD